MKTKAFLLLCLFLGIALTQLSAQNGKNGSGNIKFDITVDNWAGPIFCEGVLVDFVTCSSLTIEVKVHYVNGVEIKGINKIKFQPVVSVNTGEVYLLHGYDHWSNVKGFDKALLNLRGNKGDNISMHLTIDLTTYEFVDIQSNCH
jgi:sRNA-binding regulator protein Hfq